jgi:glycosyltransferase involved in cell wall biosynthesis
MKLSVCVPAYNHEHYIGQMLDGALMQKTTFDFEIVVGDDASTDATQQVIRDYIASYPGRIRAFLHTENQGPSSPREFAGRNNVLGLLKACNGEYVAMCEGDDYWTDPFKLQKQVDFLDAHVDYAITHHNAKVIYEDGSSDHLFNKAEQQLVSTLEDVLTDKWFMATGSWVYRNYFLTEPFADWHSLAAAGDWALLIQLASRGKVRYLPETMGVYRKHDAGLSNVHASTNRWFLRNRMEMFKNVDLWLDGRYAKTISQTVSWYEEQLSKVEKLAVDINNV